MKKDLKILVLALTIPLSLYGTGFAYAAVTSETYVITTSTTIGAGVSLTLGANCNAGDYATGGGFQVTSESIIPYSSQAGPSPNPTGWFVSFVNPTASARTVWTQVVCQTPITVAGIGVPEFGSIYIIMILGAAVYAILTKMGKLQLVPAK